MSVRKSASCLRASDVKIASCLQEEVKTMPGADAIERLKTLDAKLKKHKAGLAEHLALEAKVSTSAAYPAQLVTSCLSPLAPRV